MADSDALDPRKVTFSQAQGYEKLPGPLALEDLNDYARLELWDVFHENVNMLYDDEYGFYLDSTWSSIFKTIHRDFLREPLDQYRSDPETSNRYKDRILKSLDFNKVFDLLQMIMRHPSCPPEFTAGVVEAFERCRLAYFVDTNGPPTIFPAATRRKRKRSVRRLRSSQRLASRGLRSISETPQNSSTGVIGEELSERACMPWSPWRACWTPVHPRH